MLLHGADKLGSGVDWARAFEDAGVPAAGLLAAGLVFVEILAGLALVLGAATRAAAAALALTMLAAVLSAPHLRGIEMPSDGVTLPLVIALACGYVAVRGGGPLSVDRALARRRERARARSLNASAD